MIWNYCSGSAIGSVLLYLLMMSLVYAYIIYSGMLKDCWEGMNTGQCIKKNIVLFNH